MKVKVLVFALFLLAMGLYISWASGPQTTYTVKYHESSLVTEITLDEYNRLLMHENEIDEPFTLYVDDSITFEHNN